MVFQKLTEEHKALINQFKEQGKSNQELSQMRAKLMRGYKHDNGNFLPPVPAAPAAPATTDIKQTTAKPKAKSKTKPEKVEQLVETKPVEINNDKPTDKPVKVSKKQKAKPTEQQNEMIVKLN